MNGLGGGGYHHHHRGFYPYPFPIQYPQYGPWWGSERILLVEPDPPKDPCPVGYIYSKKLKRCVKKIADSKLPRGLKGLDGILEDPLNVIAMVGVGILGYWLGKRGR